MDDLRDISIYFSGFSCFGEKPCGFDRLMPFTLVIGRNNSGKSALIASLKSCVDGRFDHASLAESLGTDATVQLQATLSPEYLQAIYDRIPKTRNQSHGAWQWRSWWGGSRVALQVHPVKSVISITPPPGGLTGAVLDNGLALELADRSLPSFRDVQSLAVSADREILPEDQSTSLTIESSGRGFSNLIQSILHDERHPSALVEVDMLSALNQIVGPDITFERIYAMRNGKGQQWEVFLKEAGKRSPIALSRSGSGLKTILHVLGQTLIVPRTSTKSLDSYVFFIEEPENNLHPALLRRLLEYLRKLASPEGPYFFIATHSPIAIDMFADDELAQIVHVTHDGKHATCRTLSSRTDGLTVLDDLDARPSDLLQANGVIWVEGPSDRIYLNRWIEHVSGGTLREGQHYQCVFYGGSLLSHLACEGLEPNEKSVQVLVVNRNVAFLMDSDRRREDEHIRQAKHRMRVEVEQSRGFTWVTDCKEIENYLDARTVMQTLEIDAAADVGKFASFQQHWAKLSGRKPGSWSAEKTRFARKAARHMSDETLKRWDLRKQVEALCNHIRRWNGMIESDASSGAGMTQDE
jgi:predicted ATPase